MARGNNTSPIQEFKILTLATLAEDPTIINLSSVLNGTSVLALPSVLESSSVSTGALVTDGGIGVAKNITIGGQLNSTVTTGTAPLVIASTTNVLNLNASSISGATFASPGAIGISDASSGAFTTLGASGITSITNTTKIGATVNPNGSSGGALNVNGDLVMGSNTPRIYFPTNGLAFPTLTNRSAGTKIVLWSTISGSGVDFALGIGSNTLWTSVPVDTGVFRWYGGITEVMSLTGTGLNVLGNLSVGTITPKTTGTFNLGSASLEWLNIYSQNAVTVSDANKKTDIQPETLGLEFLNELSPKTYKYKSNGAASRGLIAQDVEKLCKKYSVKGLVNKEIVNNEEHYGLSYNELFSIIIKSIQELHLLVD